MPSAPAEVSVAPTPDPSDDTTEALIRRIGWRLMPFLLLMYVLAFLDRTNVGFAKDGFQQSTGITDAAYAFGASVFFFGYALLEVPSNILLVRFGARIWLARIMFLWGLVSAATFLVTGEVGFYVLRAALGVAEAGFFPGVIFYLTRFYPQRYRARAMGLFYLGAPLSFIVGGPFSGLLLDLDGVAGLHGWQWLFLIEGLLASAVGVVAFFYLSNAPEDARWLSDEERRLHARLMAADPGGHAGSGHGAGALRRALLSPGVLYLAAIYALIQMSVYGLVFFLPSQMAVIAGTRIGPLVGVLFAIPWIAALAGTWIAPAVADRTARHRAIAGGLLAMAGAGLIGSVVSGSPAVSMAGLCLAATGFIAAQPIFWSLAAARIEPAAAAASIALVNSVGALGAFAAPNLRVLAEQQFALEGAGLYLLALFAFAGAALLAGLRAPVERSAAGPG